MLELYGADTGNTRRAAIALEEAELPFTPRMVDLRGGGQQTSAFLSLNPAGQVPVLVDHARLDAPFVLTQSNAIMMYAAIHGRSECLLPRGDSERIRTLERYFYFVTDVIAWAGAAFRLGHQGHAPAVEVLEASFIERIEASERFLTDGSYMAGEAFSLADVAGFTIALAYRGRVDWHPCGALVKWFDRVEARPAVQRGLATFGP